MTRDFKLPKLKDLFRGKRATEQPKTARVVEAMVVPQAVGEARTVKNRSEPSTHPPIALSTPPSEPRSGVVVSVTLEADDRLLRPLHIPPEVRDQYGLR